MPAPNRRREMGEASSSGKDRVAAVAALQHHGFNRPAGGSTPAAERWSRARRGRPMDARPACSRPMTVNHDTVGLEMKSPPASTERMCERNPEVRACQPPCRRSVRRRHR